MCMSLRDDVFLLQFGVFLRLSDNETDTENPGKPIGYGTRVHRKRSMSSSVSSCN